MFGKAVDLLNAAQLLGRSHQDHAAFVCAIHAGINAADAIGHFEDDPYLGVEHRAAADHLRRLDVTLARPAQSLRRLVDRKSTVEYREARFTSNQAADAVRDATVLVSAAGEWIGAAFSEPSWTATGEIGDLLCDLEHRAAAEGIDLGDSPWSTTMAILAALADNGSTIDGIVGGELRPYTGGARSPQD